MNDTQRKQIRQLREEGKSYAGIASLLGLSENTIKTFCKRNGLGGVMAVTGASVGNDHFCQNCGKPKPAGAPLYKCDKCGWEPEDPTNPPKFCPECGDRFDDSDVVG